MSISPLDMDLDPSELGRSLMTAFGRAAANPVQVTSAVTWLHLELAKAGATVASVALGTEATDTSRDRRFADEAWRRNPAFVATRAVYDAARRLGDDLLTAGAGDPQTDAKARLAWEFLADALAPTNYLLTNPAALCTAFRTGGRSLLAGASNLLDDLLHNGGRPRQVDATGFEVGRNLAATPGQVVFRNDLIELIQYTPQTAQVHAVPLLASPPWINKYYVMDLAPGRSFLEWAVQHGHSVFAISYRNPDASMRDVSMQDYLVQGVETAFEQVQTITGSATVNVVGLCLGGALAAMMAAHLAHTKPGALGTLTLLNTLLDYREPGVLGAFTDAKTVDRLEQKMARTGFLDGTDMAGTFDVLRANDLIFSYVVNNWLLGQPPPAFDILAWNADNTRLPATMHAFYLRSLYVQNLLAKGELELAGARLNLADITADTYVVGAINDHIGPWTSSYQATQLLPGDVRYVLSSGGHIAGIVNPPNPKSWYQTADTNPATGTDWRTTATRHDGSWWTDWTDWAATRSGELTTPPPMGASLGAAPGTYVTG
jgi:poly[(R)-3-hydroxyalkanoate] polymerase subunit PhaC